MTGTWLGRRLKGDPTAAASKSTQHLAMAAMHSPLAVSYIVFVHPAHDALLLHWLAGGIYLLVVLGYLGSGWRARGTRESSPPTP